MTSMYAPVVDNCSISSAAYRKYGWGGKLSFQNVGGGEGVYNVLTFQKSRGGKSSPRGGKSPPRPPSP